jgi:NADPH2 dehydrogenase
MTSRPAYQTIAQLRNPSQFRSYLEKINVQLSFDEKVASGENAPLSLPYHLSDGFTIGNRFCTQPMEGWDGTFDGLPTEPTFRRWRHFGQSGAKLIWGGEAVAVRQDGRANPNQLMINEYTFTSISRLRQALVDEHRELYENTSNLLVGLQLTHSGRFSRPEKDGKLKSVIAYHHPYLDQKFNIQPDAPVISDDDLDVLVEDFIKAAALAKEAGFDFVDIKHCHGYLGHELLSATQRSGKYGGSFENRTRFLSNIISGIQERVPGLRIAVRLSAFDIVPFEPDPSTNIGRPAIHRGYHPGFCAHPDHPQEYDLTEAKTFIDLLFRLKIEMVNITGGSPYYNPHIQRPAFFPPSDGYLPPEDPLAGVARQVAVTAELKAHRPELLFVGSAYSYLQEWLPNVAQYYVRTGQVDFIGLGRMLLSYYDLPADVLFGRTIQRKRLCRTFSDCTTAPRQGMVSGCYPLDPYYRAKPQPKK